MKHFIFTSLFFCTFLKTTVAQNDGAVTIQKFESPFQLSNTDCKGVTCQVEILPDFFANEAKTSSRIYRETAKPIEGTGSLGMVPIDGFTPTLKINYPIPNPNGLNSINLKFDAKSLKNGGATNTRYATLKYLFSTDNEKTFSEETVIGFFYNEDGSVNPYSLNIPITTKELNAITIKLMAFRSKDSSGSCAKVVLDNMMIRLQNNQLSLAANSFQTALKIIDQTETYLTLNSPASGAIFNQIGKEALRFEGQEYISIQTLPKGIYIIKTTDNGLFQKIYVW